MQAFGRSGLGMIWAFVHPPMLWLPTTLCQHWLGGGIDKLIRPQTSWVPWILQENVSPKKLDGLGPAVVGSNPAGATRSTARKTSGMCFRTRNKAYEAPITHIRLFTDVIDSNKLAPLGREQSFKKQ